MGGWAGMKATETKFFEAICKASQFAIPIHQRTY